MLKKGYLFNNIVYVSISHNNNVLKKYFKDSEMDIFSMCRKIMQGHNRNEILLVHKKTKNKGFFEKFFNFFS